MSHNYASWCGAVRMLDNTLDVSRFALDAQRQQAQDRRIGVGVAGVANVQCWCAVWVIKGGGFARQLDANHPECGAPPFGERTRAFPLYDADKHLASRGIQALDQDIRTLVERHGLRNGTLTTIAPTGTTSMFAGNVSSGIEPIFSTSFTRTIITPNGEKSSERVMDYAAWQFAQIYGPNAPLPDISDRRGPVTR
jgi:ribonucleoside-diphosphate reductase alpha chain